MDFERLDKFVSTQLNISRSEARRIIRWGKITADGEALRDPSANIAPTKSRICHNGQAIEYRKYVYIVLNKPKGVLSASEDKSRQTVVQLVPEKLRRNGIAPVGRLDRDTTGLLILTDDGDFAHRVISPKSNIKKTYVAWLDGDVTEQMQAAFKNGITLADGTACRPAELVRISENKAKITVSEGKYHQIKRMFGTVGLGVNGLERISVGNFTLPEGLAPGECREMSEEEKAAVFGNL